METDYQIKKFAIINNNEEWHWVNCSKSTYYRYMWDQRRKSTDNKMSWWSKVTNKKN